MGFAERLLLRVGVILAGPTGATLAQQDKLEGWCSTGLDPIDENSEILGAGAICQHMPAGELVNCDTGGASEGSPLGARAEANEWEASSAGIVDPEVNWVNARTMFTLYGCSCYSHEHDPDSSTGYAESRTSCPDGNQHAGTVCQDARTHPHLYMDGFFSCICKPGFSGPLCQNDFDECSSQPCQNGGTCSERASDAIGGFYVCECVPGYDGDECQRDIDECASQPCRNSASCYDSNSRSDVDPDTFQCDCSAGYDGETCAHDIPECDSDICQTERGAQTRSLHRLAAQS